MSTKIDNDSNEPSHRSHRSRRHRSLTTSSSDSQKSSSTRSSKNRSKRTETSCRRRRQRSRSPNQRRNARECHRSRRSGSTDRHRMTKIRYRSVTTSPSDGPTSKTISTYKRSSQSRFRRCQRSCEERRDRSRSCDRYHGHRRYHRSKVGECHRSRRSRARDRPTYHRHSSTSTDSSDDRSSERYRHERRSRQSRNCERYHNCRQYFRSDSGCRNSGHYRSRRSTSGGGPYTVCGKDRLRNRKTFSLSCSRVSTCEKSTQTDYTNHSLESSFYSANSTYTYYQDTRTDNYSNVLPHLTDYAFLDPLIALVDSQFESPNVPSNFNYTDDSNNRNAENTHQAQPSHDNEQNMDNVTNCEEDKAIVESEQLNMVCCVKLTRLDMKDLQVRQAHKMSNINREWHSLSEKLDCKICGMCFNSHCNLVRHYVIVHPTVEVIPSRIPPGTADILRSKPVHQFKRTSDHRSKRILFEQICYFCNQIKSLSRQSWINHLASHTGYFEFPYYGGASESVSQFEWVDVKAALCNICNYVRFSETDMKNHLRNEHGLDAATNFEKVTFLRFSRNPGDRWLRDLGQLNARVKWFKSPQTNRLRDDTPAAIKNNNPEWHCLNTGSGCFICGSRDSAPGHYVNVHPNNEVVVSRLAPSVANFLRSLKYHPECKIINGGDRRLYEQLCYFCNESKCFCKSDWIDHIIRHTGHYTRQCGNCSNMSDADNCSRCKIKPTRTKNGRNLTGYLCDLCNFIRFNRTEIQNHLRNEHDDNSGMDDFEEIIFLTFPDYGKRLNRSNFILSDVADEPLPEKIEAIAGTKDASIDSRSKNSGGKIIARMHRASSAD